MLFGPHLEFYLNGSRARTVWTCPADRLLYTLVTTSDSLNDAALIHEEDVHYRKPARGYYHMNANSWPMPTPHKRRWHWCRAKLRWRSCRARCAAAGCGALFVRPRGAPTGFRDWPAPPPRCASRAGMDSSRRGAAACRRGSASVFEGGGRGMPCFNAGVSLV
jgi:hypothetical protein